MNFNLIQLWLMLQLTIRDSRAESIVIMDRDTYYAIKSKLDVVMREAGISKQERERYTLGEGGRTLDKRIRSDERDDHGACVTCKRRHIHRDGCDTLKRRDERGRP
jgi:hypothetical protein